MPPSAPATWPGADGDAPVRRHTPVADVAALPEVVVDLLVRVEVEEGAVLADRSERTMAR